MFLSKPTMDYRNSTYFFLSIIFLTFSIRIPTGTAFPLRGLAEGLTWGTNLCSDLDYITQSTKSIRWTYSWGAVPSNTTCSSFASDFEFVPMIWGRKSITDIPFISGTSQYLLGFNEPNVQSQSDLTPTEAAQLWPQVTAIAKKYNLSLVSPATAGCNTDWLTEFFTACQCENDIVAIATHSYDCSSNGIGNCIDKMAKQFKNKPLWLTEFNCGNGGKNATAAEHLAFMKEMLPVLDKSTTVQRYAWMSARDTKVPGSSLFVSNTEPDNPLFTKLGQFYGSSNSNP